MKKFLSFLLALCLVIAVFPAAIFADSSVSTTFRAKGDSYANNFEDLYYSDSFFTGDPTEYNYSLALASLGLSFLPSDNGNDDGKYFEEIMPSLGFSNIQKINYSEGDKEDNMPFCLASKTIEGKTLIVVACRCFTYNREWASNMLIGTSGDHAGFSSAAALVMEGIEQYISDCSIEAGENGENLMFWVTGYSRAGSVANLASGRIINTYSQSKCFSYPLEPAYCADGSADGDMAKNPEKYASIHNIISQDDIVTVIPPASIGFTRYGVDHVIDFDEMISDEFFTTNVTKYYGSDYDFETQTLDLYYVNLSQIDDLSIWNISDFIETLTSDNVLDELVPKISGATVDCTEFEDDFVQTAVDWNVLADRIQFNSNYTLSFTEYSYNWGWKSSQGGGTYASAQSALHDYILAYCCITDAQIEKLKNNLESLTDDYASLISKIGDLSVSYHASKNVIADSISVFDLIDNIEDWTELSDIEKYYSIQLIINILEMDELGLEDIFSSAKYPEYDGPEYATLKNDFYAACNTLFTFISEDYNNQSYNTGKNMVITGTLIRNISKLLLAHYPNVLYTKMLAEQVKNVDFEVYVNGSDMSLVVYKDIPGLKLQIASYSDKGKFLSLDYTDVNTSGTKLDNGITTVKNKSLSKGKYKIFITDSSYKPISKVYSGTIN